MSIIGFHFTDLTPTEVVFKQQVSDPKQLKPYEEVVRKLSD